jgi:hypothetical protein
MNQSLQYAKTSFKGFVNNDEWMNNSLSTFANPQTLTKDDIFAMANNCRSGSTPIFADDSKFLPTNSVKGDAGAVAVSTSTTIPDTTHTTETPLQNEIIQPNHQLSKNEILILEGIAIGIGIVVLFKMLS